MRLFFFLLILSGAGVQAQPVYVLHKPYGRQYDYIDSLYYSFDKLEPEKFSEKLLDLQQWADKNDDAQLAGEISLARYRLLFNKAERFNDSFGVKLVEIAENAHKNKLRYLEADALQRTGFFYWNKNIKHSLAFEYYLSAYNCYKQFNAEEFPPKQEYICILGSAYYIYEDYENAVKYLTEAIATKPAGKNEYRYVLYNTLALCYRKLNKYDSSEFYFRKVYEGNDPQWVSIAAGNIGINYYYEKRYAEAIPLIERDIDKSLATNQNLKNAANSMCVLATIYYLQNDLDKSEQLLVKALNICEHKAFWPNYELAGHLYTQLYKVYAARNNMRLAYLYADSALTAKDSASSQYNSLNLTKARERTDFVQHKLEAEQLMNQKKIQSLIRDCLVAGIFLLTIIGILFINRQRLKQKKLDAEKKNAEAELVAAAGLLENFRQSVQEKNTIIERFTDEMARKKEDEVQQTDTELITQLEQATILTDEQWENFRLLFEKVHKGFFVNLKKKIPDLTQAEIRFLALTKMKLTSKEMASMLGISSNAIRIYRHRLRKKLNLDKEDMIEALVESI
jgi:DNA-binding CsgD family transcriptional regulator